MTSFERFKWLKYKTEEALGNLSPLLTKWGNLFSIFAVTFLFFFFTIKKTIYWDIFTSRDLLRAVGWLEGSPYWLGPEMSAGNNLPGPMFYFLLLPALWFGNTIYSSSIFWMISWLSLTYAVAFHFLTTIIKHKESLLLFLIALISAMGPALFQTLLFAWNPGFAIMFHILSLMNIYYWRRTDKNVYLYITGLIIALGIQVHFLVSIHMVTVILFYFFKPKKNISSLLLFLSLALLPAFLYKIISYFYMVETFSGSYLKYLHWLKIELFSENWIKNIKRVFNLEYIVLGIFLCFLSIQKKWKVKKWPIKKSTRDLFLIMIIPIIIAILGARVFWYTFFIPIFLIIFFSKWIDDIMSLISSKAYDKKMNLLLIFGLISVASFLLFNRSSTSLIFNSLYSVASLQYTIILLILLVLLIVMNKKKDWENLWKSSMLLLCLFIVSQMKTTKWLVLSKKTNIPKSFSSTWPSYQDLRPIMERIFLETNWSPKAAMKHIYVVGIHTQQSLIAHYSFATEQMKKSFKFGKTDLKEKSLLERPSGYMVIQHLKKFTGYSEEDWQKYLSQSSLLSNLLRQEIVKGNIMLKSPRLYKLYWLIPYKTTKESIFQKGFHNVGQSYYWEEPDWLKDCTSTQTFKDKDELYYCMLLPGYLKRAGIHIKFFDSISQKSSHLIANITFLGPLLGTPECIINYDHYALSLWTNIRIGVSCNKRSVQYNLPNIGLDCKSQEKDANGRGKSLLTPLEIQIPLNKALKLSNCTKETLTELRLTFSNHFRHFSGSINREEKVTWKIH